MLILASQSPRRQDLLRAVGIPFRVIAPKGEEAATATSPSARARGRYADLVRRVALAKARSVAEGRSWAGGERGVVLGADTIVICDGRVMGKPADADDARRMLRGLSGRWHRVYTGLALVCETRHAVGYECTKVAFRRLSNTQIDTYVSTGEPMDKAGAYAIQGGGAALVRAIRGCYTNVIGLPVPKLLGMLAEFERGEEGAGAPRRGGC